jgi:hypothetical protein
MDEALAAVIAATVLMLDFGCRCFWNFFINQAPARAPQAPPVVHVRMHYPADFEHHLAGALTLIFGCFDLIFGYGVTETIGSLSRPA